MVDKLEIDFSSQDGILKELTLIEYELEEMKRKNGLQPDTVEMNALFKKIIILCHHELPLEMEKAVINMPEFNHLVSSILLNIFQARTLDEYYWSKKLQHENSLVSFNKTIFSQEYIDEADNEVKLLSTMCKSKPIEHIAYIGSGPLPIGSIQLLKLMPSLKRITNIDRDQQAIEHAKILAEYNHLIEKMEFIECNAEDLIPDQISRCDAIYVAFMVGHNRQSKRTILEHLYQIMPSGMFVLVRTGRGLRQILYPFIDMADLIEIGFQPMLEAYPTKKNCIGWSKLIAIKD